MGIGKPLHLPLETVDLIFGPDGLDTGLTYYLVLPPSGSDDPFGCPSQDEFSFHIIISRHRSNISSYATRNERRDILS